MDLKHRHKIDKVQTNGTISWIKTAKVKNWPETTLKLKHLSEEPVAETLGPFIRGKIRHELSV